MNMLIIYLFLGISGDELCKPSGLSSIQFQSDTSQVDSIYYKLISDSAEYVLLYHRLTNELETEGILSWETSGNVYGFRFKTSSGLIYYSNNLDENLELKKTRKLYFDEEHIFPDTLSKIPWKVSHEFWIHLRSYDKGKTGFHVIKSTEVPFNRQPLNLLKIAEVFDELIFREE